MGKTASLTGLLRVTAATLVLTLTAATVALTVVTGDSAGALPLPVRSLADVERFAIETKTIPLPSEPNEALVDEGRGVIYVSLTSSDEVLEVDLETGEVVASHFFGDPTGLSLSSNGDYLYVALGQSTGIARVDLDDWTSEQVVLPLLKDRRTWDVIEIAPGVVVVSASPSSNGTSEIVRYDFNTSSEDVVAATPGFSTLRTRPDFAMYGSEILYIGERMSDPLVRVDLTTTDLEVVAEGDGALGGAQRHSVSADNNFLLDRGGQKLDPLTLAHIGDFFPDNSPPGLALLSDDESLVYLFTELYDNGGLIRVGDAETGEELVQWQTDCGLNDLFWNALAFTKGDGSPILVGATEESLCLMDTTNIYPGTPSTTTPPTSLPPKVDRHTVDAMVIRFDGASILDLEIDPGRGVAYASINNMDMVVEVDLDTGELLDSHSFLKPSGLALSADGDHLYVGLEDSGGVAHVDLNDWSSNTVALPSMANPDTWDVVEVFPGVILASGRSNLSYPTRYDFNTGVEDRVGDGTAFLGKPRFARDGGDFVYVGEDNGIAIIHKLDVSTPLFDLVGQYDGPLNFASSLVVSPDGESLAIGSGHRIDAELLLPTGSFVEGAQMFSDDGRFVYSFGSPTLISVSDAETTQLVAEWEVDCGSPPGVPNSPVRTRFVKAPGSPQLATFGGGTICLIDTSSAPAPPTPSTTTTTTVTTTTTAPSTTTTWSAPTTTTPSEATTTTFGSTPTTAPPPPPQDHFVDDDQSIFQDAIDAIAAEGIAKGCNPPLNNRFCPNDHVTRGQMAAFLVRALGYTDDGGGNLYIDDDNTIFETDIDKLGTAGITKGCNPPLNNRFCPNDHVTRGQMAAFLARAMGLGVD
ncbi:MAG: hypothetical protein PVG83_04735 [Acidimicrobiia bacterium]